MEIKICDSLVFKPDQGMTSLVRYCLWFSRNHAWFRRQQRKFCFWQNLVLRTNPLNLPNFRCFCKMSAALDNLEVSIQLWNVMIYDLFAYCYLWLNLPE
jgi:hypothetical protein